MVCVRDFPRGEVSVKVGVMEFGLYRAHAQHMGVAFCLLSAIGVCNDMVQRKLNNVTILAYAFLGIGFRYCSLLFNLIIK